MEPALRCFGLFLATMMVVAVVGLFVAYLVAVGQGNTESWYSYTGITCMCAAFLAAVFWVGSDSRGFCRRGK